MNTEITLAQIQSFFHPRPLDSHKGTFGHIALVVGSAKYVGAAYLSAQAAINSGAGLVTVIAPKNIIPILATKLAEAIIVPLEDEQLVMTILARATVIAAGPGLEDSSASIFCLTHILETSSQPLIFDATAIAMIAQHPTLLSAYFEHQKRLLHPEQTLFTPHPGEAAVLLGSSSSAIQGNRISAITSLASTYNCTFLLKGHKTLITNNVTNTIWQNTTGNPYMASGGMGDVLTGMISAFTAQGLSIEEASLAGAYLHGAIADELCQTMFTIPANIFVQNLPFMLKKFLL